MKFDTMQDLVLTLMLLTGMPEAFAQTSAVLGNGVAAAVDRAQVKSEAKAAEKAGTIPGGDLPAKDAFAPGTGASVNRVVLKTETAA